MSLKLKLALGAGTLLFFFQNFTIPEFPARNIETRTLEKNSSGQLVTSLPHIPTVDMSLDGRVALRRKADAPNLPLYVLTPEKVKHHIQHSQNSQVGANMLSGSPYNFNIDKVLKGNKFSKQLKGYKLGRSFLCEKTERYQNPKVCNGGRSDCYRITVIARYSKSDKIRLASADLNIQIDNPKTKQAKIGKVTLAGRSEKIGPNFNISKFSEPVVVGDGRFMVGRVGNKNVGFKASDTVTTTSGATGNAINTIYSVYDTSLPQCDVRYWKKMYPISHAHWHQDSSGNPTYMRNRYKFARYQLRDSLGQPIPDGKAIGASYPWMDKDAANLFFTAYGRDNYYHEKDDGSVSGVYREHKASKSYRRPSSKSDIESFEHNSARTAGVTVAGFWTFGKAVQLDGRINNADYNFRISNIDLAGEDMSRRLKLYQTLEDMRPFERIGLVREQGPGIDRSIYHPNLTGNSSFLGSIENRFNYVDAVRPVIPRDIVWHFGTTRHMDEVVFDDFMNPYLLINAEMTGAVGYIPNKGMMKHYDGVFKGEEYPKVDLSGFPKKPSGHPLLIQNANADFEAFLKTPKYGRTIGDVRLEPISKGGIYGKGLWLHRNFGVQFKIPSQAGTQFSLASNTDFYVGVFVDAREASSDSGQPYQSLIEFGDNKQIALKKTGTDAGVAYNRILLVDNGDVVGRYTMPGPLRVFYENWTHVGIQFSANQNPVLLIDGYAVGSFSAVKGHSDSELRSFFRLKANDLITLGSVDDRQPYGVRAWVDDFKILANKATVEEQCNYARGTIIRVPNNGGYWDRLADYYDDATHSRIASQYGQPSGSDFACFVKYGNENMKTAEPVKRETFAHRKNIPAGALAMRDAITHDNKFLKYGKPRPNFSNTQFCLSCHIPANAATFPEMDIRALTRRAGVKAEDDPRRQPLQPEPFISGVIPQNYFGTGKPAKTLRDKTRHKIDKWVLDR